MIEEINNIDCAGIYYNPRKNKIGVGPFYTFSDHKFYLIVDENSIGELDLIDVTKTWLSDWEYLGKFVD